MKDWVFQIAGWSLVALALCIATRALFLDRARGRRRCRGCWYDMTSLAGLRCPECGRQAASERHLQRTRRHWRGVSAAMLIAVVAAASIVTPGIRRHGWVWALPSGALVLMPFEIESLTQRPSTLQGWRARALSEIDDRTDEGRLAHWQMRVLAARFERARPSSAQIPEATVAVAYDARSLAPIIMVSPYDCCFADDGARMPSDLMVDELAQLITSVIDFENWTENGGTLNSIGAYQGFLFIRAQPRTHREIADLLHRLEAPDSAGRFAAAAAVVERLERTPVVVPSPASVADLAAVLESALGMTVRLDLEALAEKGVLPSEPIWPPGPAPAALAALDDLGGLTGFPRMLHWDLDADGVVITTRHRSGGDRTLTAVYGFGEFGMTETEDLASFDLSAEFLRWRETEMQEIADLIRNSVDFEGWVEHGGETGQIYFYRDRILIRTTLANHARIAQFIGRLRAFRAFRPD